jgi:hypothetical protein
LLSACGGVKVSSCPPLVEYSDAFLEQLAVTIETLPENTAVFEVLADYWVLREQVDICRL